MRRRGIGIIAVFLVLLLSLIIVSYVQASTALPQTQDLFLESPTPDVNISMDFKDISLKDILKALSIQSGINFIASEAVRDRTVTLYLDNVPLEDALDKLFKANNLDYEREPGSNIIIVKDWGKPMVETVTKVFSLKHARVSSSNLQAEIDSATEEEGEEGGEGGGEEEEEEEGITEAVRNILSEHGKVIEDARTNSLIVTDIPSRMVVVEKLIKDLDVPTPQVMIEVEMLDVSKATIDKLGIKFDPNNPILQMVFTGGSRGTNFPIRQLFGNNETAVTKAGPTAGSMNFGATTFTALLDFLRTQTDTKFLARPRILTLSNETAEIKITTDEAVGTITVTSGEGAGAQTTTEAERMETGVSLRVTPQVNSDGYITLFVQPTVTEAATSDLSSSFRDPEVRESKCTLKVKDGETIVVGGLIKTNYSQTITKWPFFGDLPLIGSFFRHRHKSKDKERELIVFITPHIVEDRIEVAEAKTPAVTVWPRLEREQDEAYKTELDSVINETLNLLEKRERGR